jgi:hypothetical protein
MEEKIIEIEDLSVGDWVCAEQLCGVHSEPRLTPPMKVVSLGYGAGGWVNLEIDPEQGDPFEFTPGEIRGIPITAEVLEKNGLMRVTEEEYCEEYCCNDFFIRRSKFSCTDWWQVDVHYKQYVAHLSGYIQYVHQLQHLLTINECDKKIEL